MQDVLYDLHYTEAVLHTSGYNYGHDEAVSKYYYEVLRRHGVTQAQFDSSLVWYTDHPERFNKIYPKVLARMDEQINQQEAVWEQDHQNTSHRKTPTVSWQDWYPDQMERMMHGFHQFWPIYPKKYTINVPFFEKNAENC